jgi:pimeloyl-ACP methyl ester carboxylesterase
MPFTKKKIKLENNTTVSYLDNELNADKVLVFVHGWSADKDNLKAIYSDLSNDHRVISLDLPGFGESTMPDDMSATGDYADLLSKFIHSLNLSGINYIGHSFGGKIGIWLAANKPELIKRLVLIDSSGLKPKRYIDWYLKVYAFKTMKFFVSMVLKDPKKIESLKSRFGSDDYKNAGTKRDMFVRIVQEDLSALLPRIKCPVFLYWGEKDDATPLWMAKKMKRLIKDSAIYVVKDGTHFPFLQDNRIISIIRSFAV